MKNLMIDLETMGNNNNSVITQIGACYFDPKTGMLGKTFFRNVDMESCVRAGMEFDASTILWWLQQSDAARKSIYTGPFVPIEDALKDFAKFAGKAERVWSHVTFDHVIILNAFRRTGIKSPWHYRAAKDIRTLTALANLKAKVERKEGEGVEHNALDDAIYQVSYVVECLKHIEYRR